MNTTYYVAGIPYSAELYHHGIKGQKWGIRRFQNEDGSLTSEGMQRYTSARKIQKDLNRLDKEMAYNTGDMIKLYRKTSALDKRMTRYNKKNPNDEKGKLEKYNKKGNEYKDQANRLADSYNEMAKRKEGLMWAAMGRGMNVKAKAVPRDTTRVGEHIAKSTLATLGAMAMASVTGFGFGFYTTTGHITGTEYKVKKNKEAQQLLKSTNADLVFEGNNNGTTNLYLRPKK